MNIFDGTPLSIYLNSLIEDMRGAVQSEDREKILNVNEPDYIKYLVSRYSVEPPVIHFDRVHVSSSERLIQAERFPWGFNVINGKSYAKQVITYHIPFSGESRLFTLTPSNRLIWTMDAELKKSEIAFDIINWSNNPEEIKKTSDDNIKNIKQQFHNIESEITSYNASLEEHVTEKVVARKQELLKQANLLEQLGVPFKSKSEVSETFAIPAVRRKPMIAKPDAPIGAYVPEPTLDESQYRHILKLCQDTGTEIERHPGIYTGKDEETLRDHFIMVLSPHFESVTGETFNRQGKTDILIRHAAKNAFVAECKFWGGTKKHLETIDQILSYLTWRDSKAAILYFVKNKKLEPVLKQIIENTSQHGAFVEYKGTPAQGWHDYRFHLLQDETRNVYLAILCFHFPEGA